MWSCFAWQFGSFRKLNLSVLVDLILFQARPALQGSEWNGWGSNMAAFHTLSINSQLHGENLVILDISLAVWQILLRGMTNYTEDSCHVFNTTSSVQP